MPKLDQITFNFVKTKIPEKQRIGKILDIGCGNGLYSCRNYDPKYLVGIDRDPLNRDKFERNLLQSGVNGKFYENFDELDEDALSLKFDLISLIGVIELNSIDEVIDIIARGSSYLSHGGYFFAVYYPWNPLSAFYFPYIFKGGKTYYENSSGIYVHSHSLKQIKKIMLDAGFEIHDAGVINPYPSIFWSYSKLPDIIFSLKTAVELLPFGGRYILGKKL